MQMRNVVIVVLGLLGACGGSDPASDAQAIAALVPSDAAVCVRVASIDALAKGLTELMREGGARSSAFSSDGLVESFSMLGIDGALVARDRPLAFALVAKRAMPPQPVFVLPAKDPAKLHRSFTDNGMEADLHGDYVVAVMDGKYAKPATPSALTAAMPQHLMVAKVDISRLWTNLGVTINSGLDLARGQLREMPATPGVDMDVLFDSYFDAARAVLNSGESCELHLDLAGAGVQLRGSYTAKSGSTLDGWSSAPIDLAPFAGSMSGTGFMDMLMVADWAKLWPQFDTFIEAMLPMYSEAARPIMKKFLQSTREIYIAMGPVMVGSADLRSDGMNGAMFMAPKSGKDLAAKAAAMASDPAMAEVGYTFTTEPMREEGGVTQQAMRMKVDFSKLMAMMPADEGPEAAAVRKEMSAMADRMFGPSGLRAGYAARDGRAVIAVGEPKEALPTLLDRTGGDWPAVLKEPMTFLADCNPQMLMRMDMAAVARFVMQMAGGAGPTAPAANGPANFVMGFGVKDRNWRFTIEFAEGFFQAMRPR